MPTADVVVVQGMQFGSEAKGQIAGMIADQWHPEVVVSANHPNAGHTYIDYAGNKFIHRILPVGAAAASANYILIGPGAVIDLEVLRQELLDLSQKVDTKHKTLVIHPRASLVTEEHREAEKALVGIGSTMKGSMEAVVQKMRRNRGELNNTAANNLSKLHSFAVTSTVSAAFYDGAIDGAKKILVEGAQGFSLGIHERFYPYGTSRDVSTHQVLADCRIPFHTNIYVQGVLRTYPIRVANRFNEEGQMIGTSGPYYPDQRELQWADLGREPELTTVTRLPRRIFTYSGMQIQDAARVMGVNGLSVTFCDYLSPGEVEDFAHVATRDAHGTPVISQSFGPAYDQVMARDGAFANFGRSINMWFGKYKP